MNQKEILQLGRIDFINFSILTDLQIYQTELASSFNR
jgi:hypothetical protein